jgi:hypothetical protein
MGIRNRERRRAKKARRQARASELHPFYGFSGGRRQGAEGTSAITPHIIDTWFVAAAEAYWDGKEPNQALQGLLSLGREATCRALVARRAVLGLTDQVTLALYRGWEPRDISYLVRRKLSASAANFVEGVLAEAVRRRAPEGPRACRWEAQLAGFSTTAKSFEATSAAWGDDLVAFVAIAAFLSHLGAMPDLLVGDTRSTTSRPTSVGVGMLDKVRALLAKAEATGFEEEADAFLAKAQELMTRYNLSLAALEEAEAHEKAARVETRRCWLDDPYLKQKALLLSVVARANRCRSVLSEEAGFSTLFGHPDDLDATEMLFTSLLVHATKQMTLPLRVQARKPPVDLADLLTSGRQLSLDDISGITAAFGRAGPSRPSYRRSFLVAYAHRIGARLREAASTATEAAVHENGKELLPVLASREQGVEQAVAAMFPETTPVDFKVTDHTGWAAGVAAADMADLSWQRKLAGARH